MQKLQIRLPSFKQVSMTCEYERSHLCYIMKTFKYISVANIAKVTKGYKRLQKVQRWQSGLQKLQSPYFNI